ncbi:DUF2726 domain-containing protein [Burkholderia cenocepacia]|uniref:DUF2726 domain-containing protein n=1 Tax=Burkholderia cenocepacia TaxID=95486 RepID=UPI000760F0FB|nr:DUF2726 domain-containing protein [Burkholderia cenocepacia]KWU17959.1 hypothetical protein AS149_14895 [Burkholderia cenocepacia]
MNPVLEQLREHVENRNLLEFSTCLREHARVVYGDPQLTRLTQSVLPPILLGMLRSRLLSSQAVVELWQLIRAGTLLVVDPEILEELNLQIDPALRSLSVDAHVPAPKFWLPTSGPSNNNGATSRIEADTPPVSAAVHLMERVVVASAFSIGLTHVTDALNCTKNVCASSQEREFIKAVRQYLPNVHAYPNVPLLNFIDDDRLGGLLTERMRAYFRLAQVDVLLCTDDEDPVAGIELDSVHHDTDEARERDALKNELFEISGLPLIRIRAADSRNVRAEDFYELLNSESEALQALRPRRLRPRRNYDCLVPAEAKHKVSLEAR